MEEDEDDEDEEGDHGEGWVACQGNLRRNEGNPRVVGGRGEWWLMWPKEKTAAQKAMERRRKMKREILRRKEKAQREERQKEKELEEKKEEKGRGVQGEREKGKCSVAVKSNMYTRAKLPPPPPPPTLAPPPANATTKGVVTLAALVVPTGAGTKGEREKEGGERGRMQGEMIASTTTRTAAAVVGVAKKARDIGEIFLVGEEEEELRKGCCVMS